MIPYSIPSYERRVFIFFNGAHAWLQSHEYKSDTPFILVKFKLFKKVKSLGFSSKVDQDHKIIFIKWLIL